MPKRNLQNYQANYTNLPFEDTLRHYRQLNIFKTLEKSISGSILEIGCGHHPLFRDFDQYEKMVVVEPGDFFYKEAAEASRDNKRIQMINDFFENIVDTLKPGEFDFIVVGGFLHEIDNPDEVMQAVNKICGKQTVVYSFVPNANSFHRLLAFEMGLIADIYQKSGHDKLFDRVEVYNTDTFTDLFTRNNFTVKDCGTYFIKPFTNSQMDSMLTGNIIDKSVMDGLDKMSKYFPLHGSEIYISATAQ